MDADMDSEEYARYAERIANEFTIPSERQREERSRFIYEGTPVPQSSYIPPVKIPPHPENLEQQTEASDSSSSPSPVQTDEEQDEEPESEPDSVNCIPPAAVPHAEQFWRSIVKTEEKEIEKSFQQWRFETPPVAGLRTRSISFDGGGVRGLSSLFIVKALMEQLAPDTTDPHQLPKPCDIFDYICGTSTGGLIAILLGRLRLGVQECIEHYQVMSQQLFDISTLEKWENLGMQASKYDGQVLEQCIKDVAGYRLMFDPRRERCCKTFVVAVRSDGTRKPKLFKTYGKEAEREAVTIWEAARATCAAPTFFAPIEINGVMYVDAGLGFNNPTGILSAEIRRRYNKRHTGAAISCIISIGTGLQDIKPLDHGNILSLGISAVNWMRGLATNTWVVHETLEVEFKSSSGSKLGQKSLGGISWKKKPDQDPDLESRQGRYFRFDAPVGMASKSGLDGWHSMSMISDHTSRYLNSAETKQALKDAARILMGPRGLVTYSMSESVPALENPWDDEVGVDVTDKIIRTLTGLAGIALLGAGDFTGSLLG